MQAAIADMANYTLPVVEPDQNWHSTAASARMNGRLEYRLVVDSVASPAGGKLAASEYRSGRFAPAEGEQSKHCGCQSGPATQSERQVGDWRARTVSRWNAIPDTAGVAGSTGYDAGRRLDTHIGAVQAYANTKAGWRQQHLLAVPVGQHLLVRCTRSCTGKRSVQGARLASDCGGALAGAVVGGLIGGGVGAATAPVLELSPD